MTIICPLSTLIRIALWLAGIAVVLGIMLGHDDARDGGRPPSDAVPTHDSGVQAIVAPER